jgi:ATP-dependent DNA helicase 2 subunit 1
MTDVVQSCTLKAFNPAKYPNPALQWHYRILQASALEEDHPKVYEDKTVPRYKTIEKRVGSYAQEWAEVLDEEVPAGRAIEPASRKRKAIENGAADGAKEEKKIKREKKDSIPASTEKIESLFEQGNLMSVLPLFFCGEGANGIVEVGSIEGGVFAV